MGLAATAVVRLRRVPMRPQDRRGSGLDAFEGYELIQALPRSNSLAVPPLGVAAAGAGRPMGQHRAGEHVSCRVRTQPQRVAHALAPSSLRLKIRLP